MIKGVFLLATLKPAKTEEEIKKLTVSTVKKEYNELANTYTKLTDGTYYYCHKCGGYLSSDTFYSDSSYGSGKFPVCKKCILAMVEQREKKNDPPNETKKSVQKVLQMMNLPYIDSFYENCVKGALDGMKEKNRTSPFSTYITAMKSLPNWKGLTWKDSEFEVESENFISNKKVRKEIPIIFGRGFSDEDYLFLQEQYDDWCKRTQVDSKSQEMYIVRICFKTLDIWKAQRGNRDTKDLDKSLNELMAAANLQPKQNVGNAATDSLTFGQLIEKWEMEKPIPEPTEEFKDVDGIGKYIRVWFKGHLAKALGFNNAYSKEYEEYIKDYTVTKQELIDDEYEEDVYASLFGDEEG